MPPRKYKTKSPKLSQKHDSPATVQTTTEWTKEEKFDLYCALRTYGSYDIASIRSAIPTKSEESIQQAIDNYKNRAYNQVARKADGRRKVQPQPHARVPLISWAKLLTDNSNFEELKTDTANALRLIAKFENIPAPLVTENIDFRHIYHVISNAMEGKALENDPTVALIIDKCLREAALVSKAFIRNDTLISIMENYLQSANTVHRELSSVFRPGMQAEEAAIIHLATKSNYNPFLIARPHLKLE